jgi:hypothetical protein
MNNDQILKHYITAALWSSTGEDGEPLDASFTAEDLAPEAVARMRDDCAKFSRIAAADIAAAGLDAAQVGHDLWLTRNRHGVGFWDRAFGEVGDNLTQAAHNLGECWIYEGDDGRLYLM